MPKMFKPRYILLTLFLPLFLFAQSIPVVSNIQSEKGSAHSYRLAMQLKTNAQTAKGLALIFTQNEQIFPEKIIVNGKSFWLQNARTVPQVNNAVHWFYADSILELRFSPKAVAAGSTLKLDLHISERAPAKTDISVAMLPLGASLNEIKSLKRTSVPLPKNAQK